MRSPPWSLDLRVYCKPKSTFVDVSKYLKNHVINEPFCQVDLLVEVSS